MCPEFEHWLDVERGLLLVDSLREVGSDHRHKMFVFPLVVLLSLRKGEINKQITKIHIKKLLINYFLLLA